MRFSHTPPPQPSSLILLVVLGPLYWRRSPCDFRVRSFVVRVDVVGLVLVGSGLNALVGKKYRIVALGMIKAYSRNYLEHKS